jgi:hypothetical protein
MPQGIHVTPRNRPTQGHREAGEQTIGHERDATRGTDPQAQAPTWSPRGDLTALAAKRRTQCRRLLVRSRRICEPQRVSVGPISGRIRGLLE